MKNLIYCLLFIPVFISCSKSKSVSGDQSEKLLTELSTLAKAEEIHKNVITIDTHIDINVDNFTEQKNYTEDLDVQVTLPKMEKGGLDVAWFVVYTGQGELSPEGYEKAYANADAKFKAIHRLVNEYAPETIAFAKNPQEVRQLQREGKMVAMIGVENAYPVGTDLSRIQEFYDRGARYMSLSHNGHNQFCDSNTGEEDGEWLHGGLSELGKQAVIEMNKVGMMIDVSHPAVSSINDMLAISKAPLMASHSSSRALNDHSRNLTDEQLIAIADKGGVIQTVAFETYVNAEKAQERREIIETIRKEIFERWGEKYVTREEYRQLSQEQKEIYWELYQRSQTEVEDELKKRKNVPEGVTVADFVDHIDYMVELIGIDHVGISSDFDGGGGIRGWDDASETLNVTIELVKRGYSEEEIAKLWGENLLRVLNEVQRIANEWEE